MWAGPDPQASGLVVGAHVPTPANKGWLPDIYMHPSAEVTALGLLPLEIEKKNKKLNKRTAQLQLILALCVKDLFTCVKLVLRKGLFGQGGQEIVHGQVQPVLLRLV